MISEGINLVRVEASGARTIVGQLHDDGLNGDLVADDGTYTIQTTLVALSTDPIGLLVSVPLRGVLARVESAVAPVVATATAPSLPPEPGAAGLATLQGVDSDNDGVRDDIQRYIALTYPQSQKTRAALTQFATAAQQGILDAANGSPTDDDRTKITQAQECLSYISDPITAKNVKNNLRQLLLNTEARTDAWLAFNASLGGLVTLPPRSQWKSSCNFDPNALPN